MKLCEMGRVEGIKYGSILRLLGRSTLSPSEDRRSIKKKSEPSGRERPGPGSKRVGKRQIRVVLTVFLPIHYERDIEQKLESKYNSK